MAGREQKRSVRRGYDRLGETYDAAGGEAVPRPLVDLRDDLPAVGRLLDAGCGPGRPVLEPLSDLDRVGVDFSATQLELARERVTCPLVQGDMTRLPFQSGTFDAVTALHSVIHVPIDEHLDCYREFARVLRPGGWLVVTVAEEAWTGENDDWLDSGVRMEWSYPDLEESRSELREAGFEVVEEYAVHAEMDDYAWPFLRCRITG